MKKSSFYILILFLSSLYFFSSCRSVKQLTILQKESSRDPDTITIAHPVNSVIQTGDILDIYITSLSPDASRYFNPYPAAARVASSTVLTLNAEQTPGYLVDENGNIDIPMLGTTKISGLSTIDAKNFLKEKLKVYLKEPTVNVRILNYKITLLGEFARPSTYTIPNEKITLPEVISLGGDLTAFGRRDNILIVREVNGKKEFGHVNLNNRDVYTSPYYYLHSNDLIYVEPSAGKAVQNNSFFRVFPIVASVITLAIALFTRVL